MDELTTNSIFEDDKLICYTTDKELRKTHWFVIFEDEDYITINNLDDAMESVKKSLSKIENVQSFIFQAEIIPETQRVYINAIISYKTSRTLINKVRHLFTNYLTYFVEKTGLDLIREYCSKMQNRVAGPKFLCVNQEGIFKEDKTSTKQYMDKWISPTKKVNVSIVADRQIEKAKIEEIKKKKLKKIKEYNKIREEKIEIKKTEIIVLKEELGELRKERVELRKCIDNDKKKGDKKSEKEQLRIKVDEIKSQREVIEVTKEELYALEEEPAITTPPRSPEPSPPPSPSTKIKEKKEWKDFFSFVNQKHKYEIGRTTFEEFIPIQIERDKMIERMKQDDEEKEENLEEHIGNKINASKESESKINLSKESENRRLEALEKSNILLGDRIESERTDRLKSRITLLEGDNVNLKEKMAKLEAKIEKNKDLKQRIKNLEKFMLKIDEER